jgi:hypothetical protein
MKVINPKLSAFLYNLSFKNRSTGPIPLNNNVNLKFYFKRDGLIPILQNSGIITPGDQIISYGGLYLNTTGPGEYSNKIGDVQVVFTVLQDISTIQNPNLYSGLISRTFTFTAYNNSRIYSVGTFTAIIQVLNPGPPPQVFVFLQSDSPVINAGSGDYIGIIGTLVTTPIVAGENIVSITGQLIV